MIKNDLELVLFENDSQNANRYLDAGIRSFMIDLEIMGKDLRQLGFDTEIRPGTIHDIAAISRLKNAHIWCRLNRHGLHTRNEVEAVLASGAQVVLLPMVTSQFEVENFIRLVNHRAKTGIMIETVDGACLAHELSKFPIDYVFFGLNDFAISRGGGSIFKALIDGSVEKVRHHFKQQKFGVGGLTSPQRGTPIPSSRILEEINRLSCQFTFLRRSFRRDSMDINPTVIVREIEEYWNYCSTRDSAKKQQDHNEFFNIVQKLIKL